MIGGCKSLAPGECAAFHALVDTAHDPGAFDREVAFIIKGLYENDVWTSAKIHADVLPEYTFDPPELQLDVTHVSATTRIIAQVDGAVTIVRAYCDNAAVTCVVADQGGSLRVEVDRSRVPELLNGVTYVIVKTSSSVDDTRRIRLAGFREASG
jgi:hypothetical protein